MVVLVLCFSAPLSLSLLTPPLSLLSHWKLLAVQCVVECTTPPPPGVVEL